MKFKCMIYRTYNGTGRVAEVSFKSLAVPCTRLSWKASKQLSAWKIEQPKLKQKER